ncbi:uncharacterized protein [Diadema setosum]|uniref:uncharacterized protein n=1 Tax=Diadema setosum TaxID=31175 RepID=UPI003B3BC993
MPRHLLRSGVTGWGVDRWPSHPRGASVKWATLFACLCVLLARVNGQTEPNPQTSSPGANRQNQSTSAPSTSFSSNTTAAATALPLSPSLSSRNSSASSTDATPVDRVALSGTLEPNTTAALATNDTTGGTTAKMEITYIARMPTTRAPTEPPQTPSTHSETPIEEPENQLLNASMFDLFAKQYAEMQNLNWSVPRIECIARSFLEPMFLNFEAENGGFYCPSYYDQIQCWKASPPGVVEMQCPESFRGVPYNTNDTVTRICLFDGTWGNDNKSNYGNCSPIVTEREFDPHSRAADLITYTGYALSLTTLLGAFFILVYFKSLRCVRNYIHLNLVSSFILLCIVFFFTIILSSTFKSSSFLFSKWYCQLQMTAVMYLTLTNFFWMFVEGLYLHTMVTRALVVRRERFWVYCLIGWGLPVVFAVGHVITMLALTSTGGGECSQKNEVDYIFRVPIMIVILINVIFMSHIIIILVTKLRASHSFETQQYRKGVRGIVVLLPLLGASYFMLLVEPSPEEPNVSTRLYLYVNAFLQSTQGFFVAIIYVYMNQEVQNVVKRRFRRWREEHTLPSRHYSRRGSNSRQNSMMNNVPQFRKGSHEDNTMRTAISWKSTAGEHVGNGKVPSATRQEELLPLRPVHDSSPVLGPKLPVWPAADSSVAYHKETAALTTGGDATAPSNGVELHESLLAENESRTDGNLMDDQELNPSIAVGSDEALIVHGNTPVMEQNLFLQDKLLHENNNVQSNGLRPNGSDENLLGAPSTDVGSTIDYRMSSQAPGLIPDGNVNNSNNTQLPCILKTARERPYTCPRKRVVFVCPERIEQQTNPQQFFDSTDCDTVVDTDQTLGLPPPPPYTCSTIASDQWTREGDRSKWSPKLLFKRPKCYGSPTSQRLVPSGVEEKGKNGRIKLPKGPAGTPV